MKTLVTHINPHLDDICAIWLFKKYYPDFKDAELKFISPAKVSIVDDENIVCFGVGKGSFDEHKGDIGDCATSLVWKQIQKENLVPKDEFEKQALDELVEWVRLIDTATFPNLPFGDFTVPAFLRPRTGKSKDSNEAVKLGEEILDRILKVLILKQETKRDFDKRIEFNSRWGRGAAILSKAASRAVVSDLGGDDYALYLIKSPRSTQFFTPREDLDLTPLYRQVSELEPKAGWFLHHAKRMILCGSDTTPEVKGSQLSVNQLIKVAKET